MRITINSHAIRYGNKICLEFGVKCHTMRENNALRGHLLRRQKNAIYAKLTPKNTNPQFKYGQLKAICCYNTLRYDALFEFMAKNGAHEATK